MSHPEHETLIALFETREEAEAAARGVVSDDTRDVVTEILSAGDEPRVEAFGEVDTGSVARDVATGSVLGALGGAGGAALAGITILATGPVAAALVGAGIGAAAGAVGGAAGSTPLHRPALASMLKQALGEGRHALLIGVSAEADALAIQDALERTAAVKVVDRHGGQHGVRQRVA